MTTRRTFLSVLTTILGGGGLRNAVADAGPGSALGAEGAAPRAVGPWGMATSRSSSLDLDWLPDVARIGMSSLRGYDRDRPDASLAAAAEAGLETSGILQLGPAFPADDLEAWEAQVTSLVEAADGRVRHWEVWNEPPNFSTDKRPESYAPLVVRAYETVKRIDPTAQVGICAASVDLQFMERAIRAGAADHFDYVTLHPYETLTLLERGFEPLFLAIVPTVRAMLRAANPAREHVPVMFTEVGSPVSGDITPELQADALVKVYALSLAQGVERVHWFEGVDGDSGPFGLIARDGTHRVAFRAAERLIAHLGPRPDFLGWLEIAGAPRAFAFDGAAGPTLVAWGPPGARARFDFGTAVSVTDARTGESVVTDGAMLGAAPVIATGLSPVLVDRARANRGRRVPWNGDFAGAERVSFGADAGDDGLHPLAPAPRIEHQGVAAVDQGAAAAHRYAVDPNFENHDAAPLRIVATVARTGDAAAGMNLKYESVDGTVAAESWRNVPEGPGWHRLEWSVDDARFVGRWGYHLALDSDSPEQAGYALRELVVERR